MIAVLDYGIGNLRSAQKALQYLGADAVLATSASEAEGASGVVLPGVGAFGRCMEALRQTGLDSVATRAIADGLPFLGICVGMQMLYEWSDEDPGVAGLGVLGGAIRRLPADQKRPQMQWNVVVSTRPSAMLKDMDEGSWLYFVHSYSPEITEDTVAICDYGGDIAAASERGNVWATQFHPEKSGRTGLNLLASFLSVCGTE